MTANFAQSRRRFSSVSQLQPGFIFIMLPFPISTFAPTQMLDNYQAFENLNLTKLEDGLFPCSSIRRVFVANRYRLVLEKCGAILGFATPENQGVVNYLIDKDNLWDQSKIRLCGMPVICGAAPQFGVPFRRAIEIAMKRGSMTSCFFKPETQKGLRCSKLVIKVAEVEDKRGDLIQLEAWQFAPDSNFAHYLHALSADFDTHVCHFDGATIHYSDGDLETMLASGRKIKGDEYTKHFRIDGQISVKDMHRIVAAFLPAKELYDEAFELEAL
jgi:hypothetical protein